MTYVNLQVALNANTFSVCQPEQATLRGSITVEEAMEINAKRLVYNCESFTEFQEKSGLDYDKAVTMWEAAWENYETEEARETGN